MSFGYDNKNLKGKSPFRYVNVDTTYLNTSNGASRGKDMFNKSCWEQLGIKEDTIFTNSLPFRKNNN